MESRTKDFRTLAKLHAHGNESGAWVRAEFDNLGGRYF